MADETPTTPAGEVAISLVGEVDMSGWEPPTFEFGGMLDTGQVLRSCGTCGALVGTDTSGHVEYHRNLAETVARLTNAVTRLGVMPWATVQNVEPDGA